MLIEIWGTENTPLTGDQISHRRERLPQVTTILDHKLGLSRQNHFDFDDWDFVHER